MKKIVDALKTGKELLLIIVGIITLIITVYKFWDNNSKQLELIQKTTLRTMIWSDDIPMHDRLEACDSYLALGYNSETKRYCEKLLDEEFKK
jgi:FtsZ-interacting cell division protein ZipA